MAETVFDRVENLLNQHGIAFQVLRHEPVYTSEEAARVRGTPLASGAKALVCRGEEDFVMFVLPADRSTNSPRRKNSCAMRRGMRPPDNHSGQSPHSSAVPRQQHQQRAA